jgi:phosphohistidine phosphatase
VTQRRLIVLRHGKAEPFAATDDARRLTERGQSDALAAARYLGEAGLCPDHVVVSPAVRALATWDAVARSCEPQAEVTVDDAVYTGSVDVVVGVLRSVPAASRTVLFVGHNPAAGYLCHLLDDGEGDPTASEGLMRGLAAAALAVLEIGCPWSELGPETGRVVGFHAPS